MGNEYGDIVASFFFSFRHQLFPSEHSLRNSIKLLFFPKFCYLPAAATFFMISKMASSPLLQFNPYMLWGSTSPSFCICIISLAWLIQGWPDGFKVYRNFKNDLSNEYVGGARMVSIDLYATPLPTK